MPAAPVVAFDHAGGARRCISTTLAPWPLVRMRKAGRPPWQPEQSESQRSRACGTPMIREANPMSATVGQQHRRLVISNATVVSGCGTPAEGPVDIVIENGMITEAIKVDPIAISRYPAGWQRPRGDGQVDATGMYVIPGLIEMHVHVPLVRPSRRAGRVGLLLPADAGARRDYGAHVRFRGRGQALRAPGAGTA